MIGRVVSNKMQNTTAVLVERTKIHPLYKKLFRRSKTYLADDLLHTKLGDVVEVKEVKPLSKRKRWQIVKVLGKSMEEIAEEQMKQEAKEIIAEVLPASRGEPEKKEEKDGSTSNDSKSSR